jgi:hypothetical protein
VGRSCCAAGLVITVVSMLEDCSEGAYRSTSSPRSFSIVTVVLGVGELGGVCGGSGAADMDCVRQFDNTPRLDVGT